MSMFGPQAVETLAAMLWGFELRALSLDPEQLDRDDQVPQDRHRAEAAAVLVRVGVANREHLTERIRNTLPSGTEEWAEDIVRDVYDS